MKTNGFYILIILLMIIFLVDAEILFKLTLGIVAIFAIVIGIAVYKFRKTISKLKEQAENSTGYSAEEPVKKTDVKEPKIKSLHDEEFDMSKNNVIDTDFEEL